ncbi:MAG: hypothetical protein ABI439_14440 [Rhodospirillales bacterium]
MGKGQVGVIAGLLSFNSLRNNLRQRTMFWRRFTDLMLNLDGASAAEYALILAIIGGTIALAAITLGGSISNAMNSARDNIATCGGGC